MVLLGLDSSTPQASVALLKNQDILSEQFQSQDCSLSGQILLMVDTVLSKAQKRFEDIDGFVVTTGPGSFTGLRVGISVIKGFVLSSEKPFVGVGSLDAFAAKVKPDPKPVCVILDARKCEVYASFFKVSDGSLIKVSEDCALSPEALGERVQEPTLFYGTGVAAYRDRLQSVLGNKFIDSVDVYPGSVASFAVLQAINDFENKQSFNLNSLKINYVRKSEAEIKFGP